ncbi:MAG: PAS domain S-box protein [Desulfobacteraceae bacterium]|nr:PAS domain S-box protein [Desulfobacteraceae bacterium]MBC2754655.1 PAS domain S-box protein [Desulfobacteraceae bacterium]
MVDKPPYDELIQRIRDLKTENTTLRQDLVQVKCSENKFRMMIENIPDIIWTISADNLRTEYLSPSVETMLGYSAEELKQKSVKEMVTPASFEFGTQYLANVLEKQKTDPSIMQQTHSFEIEYICKDGSLLWMELTAKLIFGEKGNVIDIIGVSRDISKRMIAEKALKKSEERYRSLFENSRDAIYITTITGKMIEFNPSGIALFGYTRNEMIGSDILKIYDNPEDRKKFQKTIRENGYVTDYEIKFKKKDDTRIDCLLTSTLWYSETGEVLGYQGIIRDITDQKRMIQQLQQMQKMEAIGTLAGGIAHNFNNLLMTIQGNTSLMLMKTDPEHPNYKKLRTIEQHIQHGSDLSRQLLGFARGGQHESKTINLNVIVRMSSKIFATTKKEITVHYTLDDDLLPICADPGQIEQTILNLLVNAAQAMPDGGDIYIQTENVFLNEFQLAPYQNEGGRYVKISVTDTGIGMDKIIQEKIFDPFFTTKGHGQGTGLGLSSVYGIVKNHRGYVTVYSEEGKGSTFKIFLPASDKLPEKKKKATEPLLRGNETILIVDDEAMLTETGKSMLNELGYQVLTANDGKTAIETYASHPQKIDLVILDMIMPKMSGRATFNHLKIIDPAVKVLVSSGYGINGQASKLLEKGCRGFIQKPFNMMELSKKIRDSLGYKSQK